MKGCYGWKYKFTNYASVSRLPDCSKLAENWKNSNDDTIFWHEVIVKFLRLCFIYLFKFSYWPMFYVNIITGSGVMTISFYKWLNRNQEIGNTPVWVFPNIWRLGQVRNTKFGTNISYNMLLNTAKCQGYSFYCFLVIKGKPTGGKIPPPSTTQIRVKKHTNIQFFIKLNSTIAK